MLDSGPSASGGPRFLAIARRAALRNGIPFYRVSPARTKRNFPAAGPPPAGAPRPLIGLAGRGIRGSIKYATLCLKNIRIRRLHLSRTFGRSAAGAAAAAFGSPLILSRRGGTSLALGGGARLLLEIRPSPHYLCGGRPPGPVSQTPGRPARGPGAALFMAGRVEAPRESPHRARSISSTTEDGLNSFRRARLTRRRHARPAAGTAALRWRAASEGSEGGGPFFP
jgi:hypothetical protein